MSGTPMQITLYDPETDEEKGTFSRAFVPWKLLKAAIRLQKDIDLENLANLKEEDVDKLTGLVVEVFGNRFSIDELNEGADISNMVAVLNQIVAKASGNLPRNPTIPGK